MRRRKPKRYNLPNGEKSLTATALRRANRETKLDAMRTWFYANYEDPAECTPYESAEGGYIYIWGGPYEPEEKLQEGKRLINHTPLFPAFPKAAYA